MSEAPTFGGGSRHALVMVAIAGAAVGLVPDAGAERGGARRALVDLLTTATGIGCDTCLHLLIATLLQDTPQMVACAERVVGALGPRTFAGIVTRHGFGDALMPGVLDGQLQ